MEMCDATLLHAQNSSKIYLRLTDFDGERTRHNRTNHQPRCFDKSVVAFR